MSDIQDMIAASVHRMFSEMVDARIIDATEAGAWPGGLWETVQESGFTKVLAAETGDDTGGKWSSAFPVFHAIGFHRAPLPLAETILAHALLSQAGMPAPDGPLTVIQQQPGRQLLFTLDQDRLILDGTACAVPWARFADAIVVAGTIGERQLLGLIRNDAAGCSVRQAANIAGEPRDELRFERSPCVAFAVCDNALPDMPVTLYGALARAAMMAGAARSVLQQSVHYANERVQFGRPIGKFQAIQQSLAILAGEVVSAETAAMAACEAAGKAPRWFDVAAARIRAGQAASVAANIAHQVHGAIGFTHEHPLHYATRRLWSWRAEFGAESMWAEQLGRQAIERGGDAFWSELTAQQSARD